MKSGRAGYMDRMGNTGNTTGISVEKPFGKRQLGRTRRRWKNHIKMDLREIVFRMG
jgi:hypothetical protein